MPSTRYTVRLPPALDTAVQEYLRTAGTSFAVLIRQALAAYLADTLPTAPPTGSRHPLTGTPTPRRQTPTPRAASASSPRASSGHSGTNASGGWRSRP